ncbi:MAG TPA: hypothetical protein VFQ53_23085 [Kofleriaceae bacterium]|nr:hypothetical protein [Kofleriaceae bacterium]
MTQTLEPDREVIPPKADEASIARIFAGTVAAILVVCILGAVLKRVLGRAGRARRELGRRTPLVEGELVTVTGTVRAIGAPLVAPLSGAACVAHESRAQVFAGRSSTDLIAEPSARELAAFELATSDGTIVVTAEAAILDGAPARIPGISRSTPREVAFLAQHRIPADRHDAAYFHELVVRVGDVARVQGVVAFDVDPANPGERGYREAAPHRYRLVGSAKQPVKIQPC